jgi:predicted amidohydrolase
MRLLLAQLAPRRGDPDANLARLREALDASDADLAIFPELYLSGYRVGDRVYGLALHPGDPRASALGAAARERNTAIAVGAPLAAAERPGEVHNAAILAMPDGTLAWQIKRYLPSYGPFEEGHFFSPTDTSRPVALGPHRVGLEICYDAFFPEVARDLALAGADLLVTISASPVTSRPLFEKVLPARSVENGCPSVYVNRVGVEDGIVFGGGSAAWDARGEPVPLTEVAFADLGDEERLLAGEVDLADTRHWRPFRPVLRDVAARPSPNDRRAVIGTRLP